jgi:uncharacterized protein YjlB
MTEVQAFRFEDDGETPNNPRLPLLVYRAAFALERERDPAVPFERAFAAHGWGDGWRNGIFDFLHFHTRTHEVLGIARGTAKVEFGGANGKTVDLQAGDVAILPVGTGHRRLSSSRDLLVVGAYPAESCVDQHRPAQVSHDKAVADIAGTPLPQQDPVFGKDGPLKQLWKL